MYWYSIITTINILVMYLWQYVTWYGPLGPCTRSRNFSELSYWYCHEVLNFRICLFQTLSSYLFSYKVLKFCVVYFICISLFFTPYFCLYLNFTLADFGLHRPYHVTNINLMSYKSSSSCSHAVISVSNML